MANLKYISGAIGNINIDLERKQVKFTLTSEKYGTFQMSMYVNEPDTFESPEWLKDDNQAKIGYTTQVKEYNGKEYTFHNVKKAELVEEAIKDTADDDMNDDVNFDYGANVTTTKKVKPVEKPKDELDPIKDKLIEAVQLESWLIDQIHTNNAKWDWYRVLPFEEQQKYDISEYIEINTQRFTRWRKS
tara:strand:- start:2942 stop:3505 length:564 start_codon:yes stop_codon:yes gene_type:complete